MDFKDNVFWYIQARVNMIKHKIKKEFPDFLEAEEMGIQKV